MDDAGTGTKAVSVGQQLLTSGTTYNAVMGGTFAQDSVPLAAVFGKTGTLDFGAVPDQLVSPPKYPNLFIAGSATSAPEVALATAMKQHGITKFAIITGGDATGQFGAQELQAAAKSLGMTVTATEFVPDTAVDATSQMQAALASNPQALAVNNYTPVIGPILKARTKLGSKLPLWGDAYFAAANLALISTAADRKGVMVEAFPFLVQGTAASKTAAFQTFLKYDTQVNPKPLISRYADMTGWDIVMMARAAAQKAGAITPSALPAALGNISSASEVRDFLGGKSLYSPTNHTWAIAPSDYDYVPAGTSPNGLIAPGT
jgi:ABC-type branched-subunit amino acid transport system substrate-binding protein